MKLTKVFALLFAMVGLGLALCSVWVGYTFRDASPILLSLSSDARKAVDAMLNDACSGDYGAASQRILGTPKFGMNLSTEDPAEKRIWETYLDSFSYELIGECFITEDGFAQKAQITCLELDSVTTGLKERIQVLLEERIATAERAEDLYDENNDIKEIYVMAALQQAVEENLAQKTRTKTVEVTVNLIWQGDRWWIISDGALISALSGGMA